MFLAELEATPQLPYPSPLSWRSALQSSAMKVIRHFAFVLLVICCITGSLLFFDIIPRDQIEESTPWLKILLILCLIVTAAVNVLGFWYDYRMMRRQRESDRL